MSSSRRKVLGPAGDQVQTVQPAAKAPHADLESASVLQAVSTQTAGPLLGLLVLALPVPAAEEEERTPSEPTTRHNAASTNRHASFLQNTGGGGGDRANVRQLLVRTSW